MSNEASIDRKKILIVKAVMISPRYHMLRTKELSKYFDITWLVHHDKFDEDLNNYSFKGHRVITLGKKPKKKSKIKSFLLLITFYLKVIQHLHKNDYDLIISYINIMCVLLRIFGLGKNIALSMGTSAVSESHIKNYFIDLEKSFISLFFNKIITGTDWMIDKFKLTRKKVIVTRWGTQQISKEEKDFDHLRLLYLGTLTNRNIHETIEGLSLFLSKHNIPNQITYDIIGTGKSQYIDLIKNSIEKYKLTDIVRLHGYLSDDDLPYFFDKCNIGVAYIPIKDYYTNVVATKLDEYIVSGLVSIATKTNENIKVLTENNGVLIEDNPESFAEGLNYIYDNLNKYSSLLIINESKTKTLEYAVKNEIVPKYLDLMKKN